MCPLIPPYAGYINTMVRQGTVWRWLPGNLRRRYRRCSDWWSLLQSTLCYNYFTTWMIVLETALEPMFWFVDRFAKFLGPIFVTLVVLMTTSVVTIFYVCLLPHVYSSSMGWTIFHLFFGHWLLINIVFHYVMAVFTHPGTPPKMNVPEIVSICKKCISPKPPRTHHCTVCGKCILKMDHHCPWLNNCVGHHNHRYFFLFCVYMWFGTIYVSCIGHELFRQHFYGEEPTIFPSALYPLNMAYDAVYKGKGEKEVQPLIAESLSSQLDVNPDYLSHYYHVAVLYEFILCSGVTLALGLLMVWHAKLISGGETSIEVHINKKQQAKYRKKKLVYRNPYGYGFKKNWQEFLGITGPSSFILRVLLPSSHDPEEDGLTWPRALYKFSETNGLELS